MSDRRSVWIDGVHYRADRDAPVGEGGSGRWYAVVIESDGTRAIDRRVPHGEWRTMHEAQEAIRVHHARRAA